MPVKGSETEYEEVSIFDTRAHLDRGPNEAYQSCCEVKTVNRIFTLYSVDTEFLNKFIYYLEKVITLRNQISNL